jgi:N-acetylmuramoyl-L-alanine amidase
MNTQNKVLQFFTFNKIRLVAICAAMFLVFGVGGNALNKNAIAAGKNTPAVTEIRLGINGNTTRLVIEMSEKLAYSYITLADPYRIVIDLPEVSFNISGSDHAGDGKGIVDKYRFGLFRAGTSRVVLDLEKPASIEKIFVLPPNGKSSHRLVLDLKSTSARAFKAAMRAAPKRQTAQAAPVRAPSNRPQRSNNKRVIVIDAGHGGIDPGNLGSIGVPEKTIVLNIARAIRDKLSQNPEYDVRMTRDRDIFIPLGERVNIARRADADLFISVHADSFRQSSVNGGTIYTLSERASDRESELLARKENRSDLIAGIDLRDETDEVTSILIDLARRETMNYSARLTNLLLPELSSQIKMRKNSHRFAAFQVLKAPDVPSILLEAGYLTNRKDARNLNSSAGRQKIAKAMRRGVDAYFATLKAEGY